MSSKVNDKSTLRNPKILLLRNGLVPSGISVSGSTAGSLFSLVEQSETTPLNNGGDNVGWGGAYLTIELMNRHLIFNGRHYFPVSRFLVR